MEVCNDPEWRFIGCVCDEVLSYAVESEGPRGEVRSSVADVRSRCQRVERSDDTFRHTVGGRGIILGDKLPDVVKVAGSFRMKVITGQARRKS